MTIKKIKTKHLNGFTKVQKKVLIGLCFLGHCYKNGTGTIKDYRKARRWLQKAIDCHGDAEESAWEAMDLLDQLEQLENY